MIPATWEAEIGGAPRAAQTKAKDSILKKETEKKKQKGWGMAQVVECLLSKLGALSSILVAGRKGGKCNPKNRRIVTSGGLQIQKKEKVFLNYSNGQKKVNYN
jgi:hypothetical protein